MKSLFKDVKPIRLKVQDKKGNVRIGDYSVSEAVARIQYAENIGASWSVDHGTGN